MYILYLNAFLCFIMMMVFWSIAEQFKSSLFKDKFENLISAIFHETFTPFKDYFEFKSYKYAGWSIVKPLEG
jgi:NADH:ubiquinone oxidoreductase subunit 6 (subunit J)